MKNMRKFLLMAVLAFVAVFALAACNDGKDGDKKGEKVKNAAAWDKVIDDTLAQFAYNKADANYKVSVTEDFDGDAVTYTVSADGGKYLETWTGDKDTASYLYSLENGSVYRYVKPEEFNLDVKDPPPALTGGQEYYRVKQRRGDIADGQTVAYALLDEDEDIGDYLEIEGVVFGAFLKGKFDFFEFKDGKYVLKAGKASDLIKAAGWVDYDEEEDESITELSIKINGGLVTGYSIKWEYENGGKAAAASLEEEGGEEPELVEPPFDPGQDGDGQSPGGDSKSGGPGYSAVSVSLQYGGVTITLPAAEKCLDYDPL